jgi:hypothetical protein
LDKTKTIENLFIYIDIYSSLIPILLFFVFFKRTKSSIGIKLIALYCLINFSINFFLLFDNITILYELFTVIEFIFFSTFLYINLSRSLRQLVLVSAIAISGFFLIYSIKASPPLIDSVPIGIEFIFILMVSFYFLYEQMNDSTIFFIYNKYSFWIVLGMVIYLAGTFFIFIFANQLSLKELHKYWFITNIFSILKWMFFSIAIIIFSRSSYSESSNRRQEYYLS